jgi:hypothetical protein
MDIDIKRMNDQLRETFDTLAERFPDLDKKMLWATAKTIVETGTIARELRSMGFQPNPERLADIFAGSAKEHLASR